MDYEGKFRDFMVGWLGQQLKQPETKREEVFDLYSVIVDAANDEQALAEVKDALGPETAQTVWDLSRQWHDPTVEQAKPVIETLRERVRDETQDHAQFYLFFLNPFEEGCVPSGFEDRLEQEIRWMFRVFYHTVGEAVLGSKGWVPDVVVEPSYEDASNIIVLAHPQENIFRKVFVCQKWHKAWHLHFDSLSELAEELVRQRQVIEHAATVPILGYYMTEMLTELIDQGERKLK